MIDFLLIWGGFPPLLKFALIANTLYFLWRFVKMATLDTNLIEDYSDLGKPLQFKYNEVLYSIPTISPAQAKKLIKMSREIAKKASEREKIVKQLEEENKEIPEELMEEMDKLFDFQIDFIYQTGIKKIENDKFIEFDKEEINDTWSTKLIAKVFRRVNELIVGEQEKKS